jgi:hypothetical protein
MTAAHLLSPSARWHTGEENKLFRRNKGIPPEQAIKQRSDQNYASALAPTYLESRFVASLN